LFVATVAIDLGTTKILPKKTTRAMVRGNLPPIIVHTTDRNVVADILNQGLTEFLLDGNSL
jgi:hypothetical protein